MVAHALAAAFGVLLAQADLPNANLPGNSPTLPNSNLPGPVTPDQPIMLPNTDTSGWAVMEAAQLREERERQLRQDQFLDETSRWEMETRQLAAKALEESEKSRAEAAEARQAAQNAAEAQQAAQLAAQQAAQIAAQQAAQNAAQAAPQAPAAVAPAAQQPSAQQPP